MLRFAVRLVIALALCLNGFPVAMAHGDGMPMPAAAAADDGGAPCHETDMDTDAGNAAQPADHGGKHGGDCCKHGRCVCSCALAATVPTPVSSAAAPVDTRTALPVAHDVPPARYAVALRPPIA